MKNYLLSKYIKFFLKEYIHIFLTTTILLFSTPAQSSSESIFTINDIKVEGPIDLNFSREKYLHKAFVNSFEILMSKILLLRDLNKISNINLKQIKNLINSFQIVEESYSKDIYKANLKISYSDKRVKKFLGKKNIPFSQPENISVLFYPVLFVDSEIQNIYENIFYKEWTKIIIKNEIINFILPLEDLEDVSKFTKMKDKIEELNIDSFVNKYDVKNYVFSLMDYKKKKIKCTP